MFGSTANAKSNYPSEEEGKEVLPALARDVDWNIIIDTILAEMPTVEHAHRIETNSLLRVMISELCYQGVLKY